MGIERRMKERGLTHRELVTRSAPAAVGMASHPAIQGAKSEKAKQGFLRAKKLFNRCNKGSPKPQGPLKKAVLRSKSKVSKGKGKVRKYGKRNIRSKSKASLR